jgi:hypothetical protein
MAKKFAGFTEDQALVLLNKVGYTGQSLQADEVDAFLASSPAAQAKLGQYAAAAQKRFDMLTTPTTGYAVGGLAGSIFNSGALPTGGVPKDGGPLVPMPPWVTPPPPGAAQTQALQTLTNPATGETC